MLFQCICLKFQFKYIHSEDAFLILYANDLFNGSHFIFQFLGCKRYVIYVNWHETPQFVVIKFFKIDHCELKHPNIFIILHESTFEDINWLKSWCLKWRGILVFSSCEPLVEKKIFIRLRYDPSYFVDKKCWTIREQHVQKNNVEAIRMLTGVWGKKDKRKNIVV